MVMTGILIAVSGLCTGCWVWKRKQGVMALLIIVVAMFAGGGVFSAGLSKLPIDLDKVPQAERDKQVLRLGIIAELDAISLYEQLAAYAENPHIKTVFLDIAREEKTHVGEFQALLSLIDQEFKYEMEEGAKEVEELKSGEHESEETEERD